MGKSLPSRVSGPLGPVASGFLVELLELGYEWTAVHARMRLMAELSSWIAERGLVPEELTASLVDEFLEAARVLERGKQWCSSTSERQLVAYLRAVGLVAEPEVAVVSDPVERLVVEFVEYLVRERGLEADGHGLYEYKRTARLFLAGRVDPNGRRLGGLAASDVTGFVLAECRHRSVRMSSALVSSLRGLLRFLFLEGLTPTD